MSSTLVTQTPTHTMNVGYQGGERYEIGVRGHTIVVDQPADVGGEDLAPTPTELFVASPASCVAFYAGRYLSRHGYSREGLGVSVTYQMATDRPARATGAVPSVRVPATLVGSTAAALLAVIERAPSTTA